MSIERGRRPLGRVGLLALTMLSACGGAGVGGVEVVPPLAVTPAAVSLAPSARQVFTASASGTTTSVTWTIQEGSVGGSVTGTGLYTAPATVSATTTFHVVATSSADPTKTASAAVTVTLPAGATVTIAPRLASVAVGQTFKFSATVTGSTQPVVWRVAEAGGGSVASDGTYTAPGSVGTGSYHVVATLADGSASDQVPVTVTPASSGGTGLFVGVYYAIYQWGLGTGQSPIAANEIDYTTMTHLIVGMADPSGTAVDTTMGNGPGTQTQNEAQCKALTSAAHAAGKKALLCIGGWGSDGSFRTSTSTANVNAFADSVLAKLDQLGFDGVDIDWEPFDGSLDGPGFTRLVNRLRTLRPSMLIHIPILAGEDPFWGTIHTKLDWISLMNYGMNQSVGAGKNYFYSPMGGPGGDIPSILSYYAGQGIPKSKLNLGIGFSGAAWSKVTAPYQTPPSGTNVYTDDNSMNYEAITRFYCDPATGQPRSGGSYHYDTTAMQPWLSWPAPFYPGPYGWKSTWGDNGPETQWLTYEDQHSITDKGTWVKTNGYGGAIVWTIGEAVVQSGGVDNHTPGMTWVKNAFLQ